MTALPSLGHEGLGLRVQVEAHVPPTHPPTPPLSAEHYRKPPCCVARPVKQAQVLLEFG